MAAPLLAGGPQPSGERPLADPVAPRHRGLATVAGLAGGERPLAQVGGVGTRHRSPPVGVKATSTADRSAGSVDGRAIRSRANREKVGTRMPIWRDGGVDGWIVFGGPARAGPGGGGGGRDARGGDAAVRGRPLDRPPLGAGGPRRGASCR